MIRIAVIIFAVFILSCGSDGKINIERASLEEGKRIPDNRIWNMDIDITSEGKLKAKISAGFVERVYFANHNFSENFIDSGLIIDFYEKGEMTGILNSERGIINDLNEIWTATDNVVFRSLSGYTLYTDTLIWNRKTAEIHTDSDVMMVKDNRDTLYGKGFVSDDKFESYEIRQPRGKTFVDDIKR